MEPTYLKTKYPHERDAHISFDEGPHIYTIKGVSDYTSVTTWNHNHFKPFDADAIIDKMMNSPKWSQNKYFGKTKEEIKALWDTNRNQAAGAGTKLHYDIECFYNKQENENESIEYEYFKNFHEDYNSLVPYRTEWMIYDEELKLAGSIDMTFIDKDGNLEIYDWKRSKEIKKSPSFNQYAINSIIEHLPDTNYWHYSLQLNTYKAIIEKNYNKKIKGMYLVIFHPNFPNYRRIKVGDLSYEIDQLFKERKQLIN